MKILTKLRMSRHTEEVLGLVGIFYLIGLAMLTLVFVRFLTRTVNFSGGMNPSKKTPPATFNIPLAKEATKR